MTSSATNYEQWLIDAIESGEMRQSEGLDYTQYIPELYKFLSPIQRQFVDDPADQKIARCGRRGGKTFMDAIYLLITAFRDDYSPTLYLGLTRESGKEAIWPILTGVLDLLEIPYEPKVSELKIYFENGSFVRLFGADSKNAQNRLRGTKFRLIVVDEMAFFTEADSLIESVLMPTLADYGGTICMTSSPGVILSGLFYEGDVGNNAEGWKSYTWTMKDNPLFMGPPNDPNCGYETRWEEYFANKVKSVYGGDWQHPAFRREYLAEWVANDSSLIYPYARWHDKPGHNVVVKADLAKPMYGLGMDLGSVASNAIVIVAFSNYSRNVEVVHVWKEAGTSIDDLGAKLNEMYEKYDPVFAVADTGGYGKGIVDELKRRFSLPLDAADKRDKSFHQKVFGDDLLSGYIKVHKQAGAELLEEWNAIVKDEKGEEIPGQENHAADAALYIYRKLYQVHLSTFEPEPSEEDKMLKHVLDRHKARRRQEEENQTIGDYDEYGQYEH